MNSLIWRNVPQSHLSDDHRKRTNYSLFQVPGTNYLRVGLTTGNTDPTTATLTADTQLSMMIHLFSCPSCTVVFWWRMLKLDMPFSCYCTCLSCIIVFWWWITADIWATHIRKHQLKDAKVIFANRQHLSHFCNYICLVHAWAGVSLTWYLSKLLRDRHFEVTKFTQKRRKSRQ